MHKPHLRYKNQTPRERTWTIHLISLEKVLKASVLIVVGFKLLSMVGRDVHEWAADFVNRHGIDAANHYVQPLLDKLLGVGDRQLRQFSIAAFLYSAILYVEGIGLWLQKRWAEYLTSIATALFIPVEIYEIFQHPTWVRFAALGINIFIVWYLATRLRDEKTVEGNGTFIKVCGITNIDDARQAMDAGADALGFNFYEKSPRFITPARAASIFEATGKGVVKFGVFVNCPIDEIVSVVETVGLDAVQLHGDEMPDLLKDLRAKLSKDIHLVRAIRVRPDLDIESVEQIAGNADAILLDAFSEAEFGGTGETFNWEIAKDMVKRGHTVYLAGGLGPDNIAAAIREVRPFGVDACSKLERRPGLKDHRKVAEFIATVKGVK